MLTVGWAVSLYLESLGPRPSARRYLSVYEQHIYPRGFEDIPLADLTRYQVMLLAQQLKHINSQCAKAVGLLSQAYTWASCTIDPSSARPLYDGPNPAAHAMKFAKVKTPGPREVLMHRSEIVALLNGLPRLCPKYQAFFVTRLLTPGRITELCAMRRDAVDQTGKWFKQKTKNGRPQYILIPRQAMAYLQKIPADGEYFFMGHYGKPLCTDAPRKIWEKFRKEIGLDRIQLLDFRRTLATYLYSEIKADDLTAKAVLNHYDGRPVAIYTRLNYDKLSEIIQAYADWLWSLGQSCGDEILGQRAPIA